MAEDLLDKVMSLFSSDGMSDDKQNMLKQIAKELHSNKYAKFFRIRSEEADPSFSSFLFYIYKTIYPIRMFVKDEAKMTRLRSMIVESCIDINIREVSSRLNHASLDERARTVPPEQLIAMIQEDTGKLIRMFDGSKIAEANHRYELTSALAQFVSYNFPGFFKKFDSHFADGSFLIEPKFPAIKMILIIDQVGDFLTHSQPIKLEDDWNSLFQLIKAVEGRDLVPLDQFTTMVNLLREVHTSKILELMVQYTLRNPVWSWRHLTFSESVGEDWLETKKAEAASYINKINTAMKNNKIAALVKEIFESTDLTRLDNYTPQLSEPFRRKGLDFFIYAEGLNYLKAFMDDFIDKEIKELLDILLIRGQWTNKAMEKEMNEALHRLSELPPRIHELDELMSEDGGDGSRLRASMLRVDRDHTQARYINSIIGKNNSDAYDIISEAAQDLIIIGKHLKSVIEDLQKKHPELLINWKELSYASKEPLVQRMTNDFKKINYFVQLMHLCTQ